MLDEILITLSVNCSIEELLFVISAGEEYDSSAPTTHFQLYRFVQPARHMIRKSLYLSVPSLTTLSNATDALYRRDANKLHWLKQIEEVVVIRGGMFKPEGVRKRNTSFA